MERLTARDGHGIPKLKGISESQRLCPKDRVLILDGVDRLTAYEDAMPLERAQELAKAEQAGRLVVLPEVREADRQAFVDGLHDYFQEAANYDPSVGIFGMREGEAELANALMKALGQRDGGVER